jgi:hypothetical protein
MIDVIKYRQKTVKNAIITELKTVRNSEAFEPGKLGKKVPFFKNTKKVDFFVKNAEKTVKMAPLRQFFKFESNF